MPIHLPPFSRRRFVGGAAAVGAGLVLPRELFAADDAPIDPHAWALLADTHVSQKRDATDHKINMFDNAVAVGNEVLALKPRPAGVIINGDCTYQRGYEPDYTVFLDAIRPMREGKLTVHLVLGNHDNRDNFYKVAAPDDPAKRPVARKHIGIIETERANLFLLDTLLGRREGQFGETQLKWLATALDARASKPALVIAHHTPAKGEPETKNGITDTDAFYDVILPRKHVKAFIFGHSHRWRTSKEADLHLVNLPPTSYLFEPTFPNGWVHMTLQKDGATFELRALDTKHPQHGQRIDLKWRAG